MHIAEGMISGSAQGIAVLVAGAGVAAAGTAVGLRRIDYQQVPQVAMLSAAFFVASLISVPIGPTSVHLVLNGLVGVVLGWAAFPAILIGLFLQAIFFGAGGLTTLGVNTTTMALPAVISYYLCNGPVRSKYPIVALGSGFVAGALATVLGAALTALAVLAAGRQFAVFSQAVLIAHLGVAVVEGVVTGSVVAFVRRVQPELLDAPLLQPEP